MRAGDLLLRRRASGSRASTAARRAGRRTSPVAARGSAPPGRRPGRILMIMPGCVDLVDRLLQVAVAAGLALVPQRLVGGASSGREASRHARSKSAWSVLQTSRRGPSVRYVGTLPEPSGACDSRSSWADAGAAGVSAIRPMPSRMAVGPRVHRLMRANPRSRPASTQRLASPSAGGWSSVVRASPLVRPSSCASVGRPSSDAGFSFDRPSSLARVSSLRRV